MKGVELAVFIFERERLRFLQSALAVSCKFIDIHMLLVIDGAVGCRLWAVAISSYH